MCVCGYIAFMEDDYCLYIYIYIERERERDRETEREKEDAVHGR